MASNRRELVTSEELKVKYENLYCYINFLQSIHVMIYQSSFVACSRKSYMIDTFLFLRILNPIKHRKLSRNIDIFTKIDIYSDSI
jgi:hypothetical protein